MRILKILTMFLLVVLSALVIIPLIVGNQP
jgi:hypothetical protein